MVAGGGMNAKVYNALQERIVPLGGTFHALQLVQEEKFQGCACC